MGADIKQLRTRIKSVDSTLHLTKAMGLVASSKIRKALDGMGKGRAYAEGLDSTLAMLTSCDECKKSPYLTQRMGEKLRLVVIAGDRGLAGGYNANIFRLLREYPTAEIVPIGKRACERFGAEIVRAEGYSHAAALQLAEQLCKEYADGDFDKIGVVCTKYVSAMSQEAYVKWLFPLPISQNKQGNDAVFEPDPLTVFHTVLPEYIAGELIACVKESFACEVASRSVAMDSAGKNAQEMLDSLGLEYNRARQGAITQEITEIVAGSGL